MGTGRRRAGGTGRRRVRGGRDPWMLLGGVIGGGGYGGRDPYMPLGGISGGIKRGYVGGS
eukprot:225467-Rhodomonas_salina.2